MREVRARIALAWVVVRLQLVVAPEQLAKQGRRVMVVAVVLRVRRRNAKAVATNDLPFAR